jgi:hypothetical protein
VPPEGGRCNFVHCLKVLTQTRSRTDGGGERVWCVSGKKGTGINKTKRGGGGYTTGIKAGH